jgi:hypothetical protein
MVMCWGPSTQRQAQKLILGPSATAKGLGYCPELLLASFTRHKTLRRHLYLVGLMDSPLCRKHLTVHSRNTVKLYSCRFCSLWHKILIQCQLTAL